jgi:perosamine synthetase
MFNIDLFIEFTRKVFSSSEFIPLHEPRFSDREKELVSDCIDSTFVSSVGKYVDQFESRIAEYTGAKKAVAVVNGTQALFIALKLAGANKSTEVITQSLTFIATANAISYTGASPVFVDVDRDTMGMSPSSLKSFLETETETKNGVCVNRKTGRQIIGCIPMHTFGFPCRIEEIVDICDQHGIVVIEDAAESLGSFVGRQHTGTFGKMGILSFNGNKIITTGGGGMILFQDEELAKKAKHLTTTAKVPHPWEFIHDEVGYNFRMPNLNAALGVAQMESLPDFLAKKKQLHAEYKKFFHDQEVILCIEREGTTANFWLNAVYMKDKQGRDNFLERTNKEGVMTRSLWTPMHKLPIYNSCQKSNLDNTEFLFDRIVNIPSSVPVIT